MASEKATKRYHIWLDYKGYLLVPNSMQESEAPLFGTKFATGEPSYQALDFWQRTGATDFQRGHGQKFQVDPAMFQQSLGLELQDIPGQITLARTPGAVTSAAVSEITAKLVTRTKTYFGTSDGKIYSGSNPLSSVALEKDTLSAAKITDFFEWAGNIFACIPTEKLWYNPTGVWTTTDVTNLNHAEVWGDFVYGSFGLTVKYTTTPQTLAEWANTAFTLPSNDEAINKIVMAHNRLYVGTYTNLWVYQGGGEPWMLYSFAWVRDSHNFEGLVLGDNLLWFNIYKLGIFYTDGARIATTSIGIENEYLKFKYALGVSTNGPKIWALYQKTDNRYYLAKSLFRNYWFDYCEVAGAGILASYSDILYLAKTDGLIDKLDDLCAYQRSGYLIASLFDANLICLDKLVHSLYCYHEPLKTGQTVTLKANFDEAYINDEFASWVSASHSYAVGITTPGFKVNFKGYQEAGKLTYQGGLFAQRFQYGVVLAQTGATSPVVQDVFWEYYLERPYGDPARKLDYQFVIIARDELEKLDAEKKETYETDPRTAEEIATELRDSRRSKGLKHFVGPEHELTQAFRLGYNGTSCKVTIDQVNGRMALDVTGGTGADQDLNLADTDKDTIGELVTFLNGLTGFTCIISNWARSSTLSNSLLPVKEIESAGTAGKWFYTTTDLHKVIWLAYRKRYQRLRTDQQQEVLLYIQLREA